MLLIVLLQYLIIECAFVNYFFGYSKLVKFVAFGWHNGSSCSAHELGLERK